MDSDFRFIIKPRAPEPLPPPFRCSICQETIQPNPARWGNKEKPPVCLSCVRHWGRHFGYNARTATYGDRINMRTIAALVTRIDWEVKNGRHAY